MKTLLKTLHLSQDDYYRIHLHTVNCILPVKMTEAQIGLLATFMGLRLSQQFPELMFSTEARKEVRAKLGGLSPSSLSNFIRDLLKEGFLLKDDSGRIVLWKLLIPEPNEQLYQFRFINKDYNATTHTAANN